MNNSLKSRIIHSFLLGFFDFMLICILKKFLGAENYLSFALAWAIPYGLGHFLAKALQDKTILKMLHIEALVFLASVVVVSFIFGVIVNSPNWFETVFYISVSLVISLLLNNKWIRN